MPGRIPATHGKSGPGWQAWEWAWGRAGGPSSVGPSSPWAQGLWKVRRQARSRSDLPSLFWLDPNPSAKCTLGAGLRADIPSCLEEGVAGLSTL